MILFSLVGTDMVLEWANVEGQGKIDMTQSKRWSALAVYSIILLCQLCGIAISHRIIAFKNKWAQHVHALQLAVLEKSEKPPSPPQGMRWHFFLSHCQSTAGDAVHSLCLELEKKGFQVWCVVAVCITYLVCGPP